MRVRDTDELRHSTRIARILGLFVDLGEVHPIPGEDLLRQPAGTAAAVLPHVLQDVGHLQPLSERGGQTRQRGAVPRDLR